MPEGIQVGRGQRRGTARAIRLAAKSRKHDRARGTRAEAARVTVTATRRDGRATVSRHGNTDVAVAHAVALAMQLHGRGRAYRRVTLSGRVAGRVAGDSFAVYRVSPRDLAVVLARIDTARAAKATVGDGVLLGRLMARDDRPDLPARPPIVLPVPRPDAERAAWLAEHGIVVPAPVPDEVLLALRPDPVLTTPYVPNPNSVGIWHLRHDLPPFAVLP